MEITTLTMTPTLLRFRGIISDPGIPGAPGMGWLYVGGYP
jgi:hypothetical protein